MPVITTSRLELVDGSGRPNGNVDTVRLTFEFTDGQFDFGIQDYFDFSPPRHRLNFFTSSNGSAMTPISSTVIWPQSQAPFTLINVPSTQSGTIVSFEKLKKQDASVIYTCGNFNNHFEQLAVKMSDKAFIPTSSRIIDTLNLDIGEVLLLSDSFLIERNKYFNNVLVDYMVEQADGSFEKFDWVNQFCVDGFNGRAPVMQKKLINFGPFKTQLLSDQKGRVIYNTGIPGVRNLFGGKRVKLRFSIIDRSLNESNVMETMPILIPKP